MFIKLLTSTVLNKLLDPEPDPNSDPNPNQEQKFRIRIRFQLKKLGSSRIRIRIRIRIRNTDRKVNRFNTKGKQQIAIINQDLHVLPVHELEPLLGGPGHLVPAYDDPAVAQPAHVTVLSSTE